MNKTIKNISEVVIGLLILIGLAVGTPKILTTVMKTNYPVASITSGSMWPVIKKGDMVFITGVEEKDLQIGDIIVFHNSNKLDEVNKGLTIHRIIRLEKDQITTKGDANKFEDLPISYDKVVGRTLNWSKNKPVRIPKIGDFTNFIARFK